ncbi:MAG: hypothetical protein AAFQ65_03720 [Myxococcota bacterium]
MRDKHHLDSKALLRICAHPQSLARGAPSGLRAPGSETETETETDADADADAETDADADAWHAVATHSQIGLSID